MTTSTADSPRSGPPRQAKRQKQGSSTQRSIKQPYPSPNSNNSDPTDCAKSSLQAREKRLEVPDDENSQSLVSSHTHESSQTQVNPARNYKEGLLDDARVLYERVEQRVFDYIYQENAWELTCDLIDTMWREEATKMLSRDGNFKIDMKADEESKKKVCKKNSWFLSLY